MSNKEATARIKINQLLEIAGWRFFADQNSPANICLEPKVNLTTNVLVDLGENFEKTTKGYIDFLLLDAKGAPLIVLEAIGGQKPTGRQRTGPQICPFSKLSFRDPLQWKSSLFLGS